MKDRVECGFKKWAIGLSDDAEIVVEFTHEPLHGTINLRDVSVPELRQLGEMFLSAARSLEQNAAKLFAEKEAMQQATKKAIAEKLATTNDTATQDTITDTKGNNQ